MKKNITQKNFKKTRTQSIKDIRKYLKDMYIMELSKSVKRGMKEAKEKKQK
jgi:hypothetical protein